MTNADKRTAGNASGPSSSWFVSMLRYFAAATVGVMTVLIFVDVIARYVFNSPISGSFEYAEFLLLWTIFAAFGLVTRGQQHITVDLLDNLYRGRVRWIQQVLVRIICVGVIAFITWRLWDQGEFDRANDRVGEYLDLPLWPIIHVATFLSFCALLFQIGNVWRLFRRGTADK